MIIDRCSLITEKMYAGVPQFIDIEDKIAFGLTGKQLLWLGAGVALLVVAYTAFDSQLFLVIGLFIAVIFGGFAFWRPQGVPLVTFVGYTFQYFAKPRKYIWKRVYRDDSLERKKAALAQSKNAAPPTPVKHLPARGQLKRIAWELDTRK
ncbi:MAG: PrgI family protein [Candidatus Moranbacteria bacterium]|nr:PrgI family protein [Candidatus Moranbacteria bacterium]